MKFFLAVLLLGASLVAASPVPCDNGQCCDTPECVQL
ncbi:hypothetical protein Ptr902_10240 [Pyrenophora tritici-repentis]|uniref:Uncharacterized protein n=1 Tax=Pyrenophora tritici-repentis TaxID=45151 RepID=A0A5M9L2M3_9PLEO|nr:hypothetical protein PtrV1_11340 [Pyrenophora tritici-repentis]KAF7443458.1 hypothetical protein A1F99_115320 [Pyrenophora tritici-repentis]KAF7566828.1 hypothetical protein PtrM4_151480 [Pyrenophora tritici-repentis]KAI0570219.1 hypothetical protein Alg215_11191 [Pyrenophora tritici-repentis]KAI0570832.1 hypothetical protein Alg130_11086 [Pyrenophora tritici-repentis]